jgi:hypothetical protein
VHRKADGKYISGHPGIFAFPAAGPAYDPQAQDDIFRPAAPAEKYRRSGYQQPGNARTEPPRSRPEIRGPARVHVFRVPHPQMLCLTRGPAAQAPHAMETSQGIMPEFTVLAECC